MAVFDYTVPRATANRLLTKFGRSMVIGRRSAGTYDPTAGSVTVSSTAATVTAADFDVETVLGGRRLDPGSVEVGDRTVLVSPLDASGTALAFTPDVDDTITIGGDAWKIVRVSQTINPAGTVVLYILQVRR